MQVRKLSWGHRNHSEITIAISYPVSGAANTLFLIVNRLKTKQIKPCSRELWNNLLLSKNIVS